MFAKLSLSLIILQCFVTRSAAERAALKDVSVHMAVSHEGETEIVAAVKEKLKGMTSTVVTTHVPLLSDENTMKVVAFSDVHGRVANPDGDSEASNIEDFIGSDLAKEIEAGSGGPAVLVYAGDMSLLPIVEQHLRDPDATTAEESCCSCIPTVEAEITQFATWFGGLSKDLYPVKIILPGNHDSCLDTKLSKEGGAEAERLTDLFRSLGITYLGGSVTQVDTIAVRTASASGTKYGIRIAGSGLSEARTLGEKGAFQKPPFTKPQFSPGTKIAQKMALSEQQCGPDKNEECTQELYDEYNEAILAPFRTLASSASSNPVDILVMHGPPDNAGAVFAKSPGGPLVELLEQIAPAMVICGHIHAADRATELGAPYELNDLKIHNVAVKKNRPEAREDEPYFQIPLSSITFDVQAREMED